MDEIITSGDPLSALLAAWRADIESEAADLGITTDTAMTVIRTAVAR